MKAIITKLFIAATLLLRSLSADLTHVTAYAFLLYATNANATVLTPPSAPTNVVARPGENGMVTVSWDEPKNIGGSTESTTILYTVSYGVTGEFPYKTIIENCTNITDKSCEVKDLKLYKDTNLGQTPAYDTSTVMGLKLYQETDPEKEPLAYTFKVTAAVEDVNEGKPAPYLAGYSNSVTPTTSLGVSVNALVLSVNDRDKNQALTGKPRTITLTNFSSGEITNLEVVLPYWSALGTTAETNCQSDSLKVVEATCTITVTPNKSSTSGCAEGKEPSPDFIEIKYSNKDDPNGSIKIPVYVLGYGCIYQGGYVFSIDDTTPEDSSIGGKVLATKDQSEGDKYEHEGIQVFWDISDKNTPDDPIWGIYAKDDTLYDKDTNYIDGQLKCDAKSDGLCNTNNIVVKASKDNVRYPTTTASMWCSQPLIGTSSTVCKAGTEGCYNDWYLPAICEWDSRNNSGDYDVCDNKMQSVQMNIAQFVFTLVFINSSDRFWSSSIYREYSSDYRMSLLIFYDNKAIQTKKETGINSWLIKNRCVRGLTN